VALAVDASVACKWFIAELQAAEAEALLTADAPCWPPILSSPRSATPPG
jgi:hypothetical protein